MKLYDVAECMVALHAEVEAADGELPANLEARLDELTESFDAKAEAICKYRANALAEAAAAKDEAERLQTMARKAEARAERLRRYLHQAMLTIGADKVSLRLFKLQIWKNSVPSVEVRGLVHDLPMWAQRHTVEADKAALADAWKRNEQLPDGVVVTQGTHLRIK